MRWKPFDIPLEDVNFVDGLHTICGSGNVHSHHGIAIHIYICTTSMKKTAFCNNDGDFLIGKLNFFIGFLLYVPRMVGFVLVLRMVKNKQ